jgi:hypothetical protein
VTAVVLQDKNGVCYLRTRAGVTVAPGVIGITAIVNRGHAVQVVKIDNDTVDSLWLQPTEQQNVVSVINKLLSPSDPGATISTFAQVELARILKEEVKMAEKKAAETKAEKTKKFAAPAAEKSAPAEKAEKAERRPMTLAELADNELYATKVRATEKIKDAKAGSLWAYVRDYAQKAIPLHELIKKVVDSDLVLKSEKEREIVLRIRIKDAFTRMEYLEAVK